MRGSPVPSRSLTVRSAMREVVNEGRFAKLTPRDVALEDFFARWEPSPDQTATEYVRLDDAIGRIAAEDIFSRNDLPVVRASGMDGIAVRSADFADGMPDTSKWMVERDYTRADTGDDFPDEFDATIAIESVHVQPDGSIVLDEDVHVEPGSNVRKAGSTMAKNDLLIEGGMPIRPTDLANLALGGVSMVPVRRKPRVGFVPTGSELVPEGTVPRRGQMIDANSPMVKHMLIEYGAEPVMYPIVPDDPVELERTFDNALVNCDVVVMNGGSAVGGEDYNVELIEKRGEVVHHYIAAVPGRPMMLAVVDGKPVIDLPGPPMAAYFGTTWCLNAVVSRFLGVPVRQNHTVPAVVDEDTSGPSRMDRISRVDLYRADGGYKVHFRGKHGPVSQNLASNAQYISHIGEGKLEKGQQIQVELLRPEEFIG